MAVFSMASCPLVCPLKTKLVKGPVETYLLLGALQTSPQGGCSGNLSI